MEKKEEQIIWSILHYNDLSLDQLFDLLELRTAVFVVEQDCPYQEVDEKDKSSYHVLGYSKQELIAVARIIPKGLSYKEVSFGRVAIKKEYRGKGLANLLSKKLISYISVHLNEAVIRISAQCYLQAFYENHGFKISSKEYLEDGIPHIEMLRSAN